jgi:hypothetical protein
MKDPILVNLRQTQRTTTVRQIEAFHILKESGLEFANGVEQAGRSLGILFAVLLESRG